MISRLRYILPIFNANTAGREDESVVRIIGQEMQQQNSKDNDHKKQQTPVKLAASYLPKNVLGVPK